MIPGLTLAWALTVAPAAAAASDYPTSEAHYAALEAAAHDPKPPTWKDLPDWTGIWLKTSPRRADAPLNAKGAALYAETAAMAKAGREWDHLSDCLPSGYPRMLNEPFEREFILRPETVWMHNVNAEETRRIYTDGRGHLPEDAAYPLWEGDSIGFWDGARLIVHTTHVRGYPRGYYRMGPPSSERLTAVEVWTMPDPDHLQVDATFYDPEYLARPWRVMHRYERVAKGVSLTNRADQWVCNENSNVRKDADGGTRQLLPGEPGYRAPSAILSPK